MHALRTLRSYGMDIELLQTVYRAVIVAKLLYASCAWCGFTTASDRQRLEASLRRAQRSGLIILNLALSTMTVILFTECCLQTILTFLTHCKCSCFIFIQIYVLPLPLL